MPMQFATEWQVSDNRGHPQLVCPRLYSIFPILSTVEGAYKHTHIHICSCVRLVEMIDRKKKSNQGETFLYNQRPTTLSVKSPGGGGGGTSILKVTGTCHWTGYDFAVINISTGYLVALLRSSILAQGILWPSCGHQYWHRVSKSA